MHGLHARMHACMKLGHTHELACAAGRTDRAAQHGTACCLHQRPHFLAALRLRADVPLTRHDGDLAFQRPPRACATDTSRTRSHGQSCRAARRLLLLIIQLLLLLLRQRLAEVRSKDGEAPRRWVHPEKLDLSNGVRGGCRCRGFDGEQAVCL